MFLRVDGNNCCCPDLNKPLMKSQMQLQQQQLQSLDGSSLAYAKAESSTMTAPVQQLRQKQSGLSARASSAWLSYNNINSPKLECAIKQKKNTKKYTWYHSLTCTVPPSATKCYWHTCVATWSLDVTPIFWIFIVLFESILAIFLQSTYLLCKKTLVYLASHN